MAITILDGPMGTELLARGVPTPLPGWSSHALEAAPEVVAQIHRDYAAAGATVHTTNTFRTRRALLPNRWERLARQAVDLARQAVPTEHRIAGSIAPLEDCYSPELSPAETDEAHTRREHRDLALVLADAGCDLLLCETFPHVGEGLLALEEAVATGLPTWVSFTPGPTAGLLSPEEIAAAGRQAVERGARAVLVNCVAANQMLAYLQALAEALGLVRSGAHSFVEVEGAGQARQAEDQRDPEENPVLLGCYANAGRPEAKMGWSGEDPGPPERHARLAREWVQAGARIVGGCCGTGPAHLRALALALQAGPA